MRFVRSLIVYHTRQAWWWDHVVDTSSFAKYKRYVNDARSFTASLSRWISCGRNRAGHSRDCVEYSFPGTLFLSLSSEWPVASGENICCFTIWHTRSLFVFLALTQCENVAFTRQDDVVIAQTSANGIHYDCPRRTNRILHFPPGQSLFQLERSKAKGKLGFSKICFNFVQPSSISIWMIRSMFGILNSFTSLIYLASYTVFF